MIAISTAFGYHRLPHGGFALSHGHLTGPHVDFAGLSPLIALLGGACVVLLVGLVRSMVVRERIVPLLALASLASALGLTIWQWNSSKAIVSAALQVDDLSLVLNLVLITAGAAAVVLSWRSRAAQEAGHGEYHALLLTSIAGMAILAGAQNLVALFVGLELLSIPLYVMCASELRRDRSLEAGLKYLIIGSVGSATLLYGLALIYGATGSTDFTAIADTVSGTGFAHDSLLLTGIALALVGFAFKASVAPFHQWTPDVYEGAPTPVTAFMAVSTKVAALGATVRLLDIALAGAQPTWAPALATLATITIVVGNVGALGQSSLKRLLAYSSVAQAGYMLAGIVVSTQLGVRALVFYLVAYLFMNLAAFAVVIARERETDLGDDISAVAGLGRSRPWLAWPMTIAMLALAGIPGTAGFVGKFYLIDASVSGDWTWLAIVIVVGSMISLGYYLRVIATMWMREAPSVAEAARSGAAVSVAGGGGAQAGALPVIAGGAPEADAIPRELGDGGESPGGLTESAARPGESPRGGPNLELTMLAVACGAASVFFGIVPQPLFDLVHHVGGAVGGLF